MKKFAVLISGCGHRDGTEITEAVSALVVLGEYRASYDVFAPNISFSVTDPLTANATAETRNVMAEAARISRGKIRDLKTLKAAEFDGLVMPGGFGAALHLSDWAHKGAACKVQPDVERVIKEFFEEEKPIAAICIAPAVVAKVLGAHGITVTIGDDPDTAAEIKKTGAHHENCTVDDYVSDREHRLITTPAYMYDDATPFQVFTGVRKALKEFVEIA